MKRLYLWNAPAKEAQDIMALTAQIVQLKQGSNQSSDVSGSAGTWTNNNSQTHAWKLIAPGPNNPQKKTVKRKEFHWCPHHASWCVHKPSECRKADPNTHPANKATTANTTALTTGSLAAELAAIQADERIAMLGWCRAWFIVWIFLSMAGNCQSIAQCMIHGVLIAIITGALALAPMTLKTILPAYCSLHTNL